jgi:hypothetical protein
VVLLGCDEKPWRKVISVRNSQKSELYEGKNVSELFYIWKIPDM